MLQTPVSPTAAVPGFLAYAMTATLLKRHGHYRCQHLYLCKGSLLHVPCLYA
jgi:hypothetical protein